MLGQQNGENLTEGGWTSVEGKKVWTSGTYNRKNFLTACGQLQTFIMIHG
jgi:hypothetical protein